MRHILSRLIGCFALTWVFFVVPAIATPLNAQEGSAKPWPEYLVKAGFLYNFAKLTQWPGAQGRPAGGQSADRFQFCVLGRNPFEAHLDTLHGKTIAGRPVAVRVFSDAAEAEGCQILFISETEAGRLQQHLAILRGKPVLTVSDMPHFSRAGGMIGLKTVDNHVRFEINLTTTQSAGLILSSRLLSLAELTGNARPAAEVN